MALQTLRPRTTRHHDMSPASPETRPAQKQAFRQEDSETAKTVEPLACSFCLQFVLMERRQGRSWGTGVCRGEPPRADSRASLFWTCPLLGLCQFRDGSCLQRCTTRRAAGRINAVNLRAPWQTLGHMYMYLTRFMLSISQCKLHTSAIKQLAERVNGPPFPGEDMVHSLASVYPARFPSPRC